MSLTTQDINAWPSANAKEMGRWESWEQADAWMQQDKANRLVEGVVRGHRSHEQVLWERVDKNKDMRFDYGHAGTTRWLNFYTQASESGGCLWRSGLRWPGVNMVSGPLPASAYCSIDDEIAMNNLVSDAQCAPPARAVRFCRTQRLTTRPPTLAASARCTVPPTLHHIHVP